MSAVSMSLWALENHDWLTEYDWYLEDGRDFGHIYWHKFMIPYGSFGKVDIPLNCTVYRERLRKEVFDYFYQTEEKDKLFPIGGSYTSYYDIKYRDNFSHISLYMDGYAHGGRKRVGKQINPADPLIGIWGELPYLSEYRLVKPDNYVFYLDIDKEIPGWAVPKGTYLLKQTGDKVFETDSSFPDGYLRLEILSQEVLLLTPLYTVPAKEGFTYPLILRRIPKRHG